MFRFRTAYSSVCQAKTKAENHRARRSWVGFMTFRLRIDDLLTDCLISKYVVDTTLTEIIYSRNDSSDMENFFHGATKHRIGYIGV